MRRSVMALVMAGGRGTRLGPLTKDRAKPAVPFGGRYRIIDFALSNLINSNIFSVYVLTQFKCQSLLDHLNNAWNFGSALPSHFVKAVPAQMRRGAHWYAGTADSIFQNVHIIREGNPDLVAVLAGDHIYRMDINQWIQFHFQVGADVSVSCIPMDVQSAAGLFGIFEVDSNWRVLGFEEKPLAPKEIPGRPGVCLVSMGNYLFEPQSLIDELELDHQIHAEHDFGKTIMPELIDRRELFVYNYATNIVQGSSESERGYWRDVGTIDSYYQANMDLKSITPVFNLYNQKWPIRTSSHNSPPAKFVHDSKGRTGRAINSIVSEGTIVSGSVVSDSVLGRDIHVHSFCEIKDTIIFNEVTIGRGAKIRRAIIDKYVTIAPGDRIGYDREKDAERFYVTPSGIVIIAKQAKIAAKYSQAYI